MTEIPQGLTSLDDDLIGDIPDDPDRRAFLSLLGGGIVAAGSAAWYFSGSDEGRAAARGDSAAGPPRKGGDFVFAYDAGPSPRALLDPHNSGFAPANRVIRSVFDNLVVLKADNSIGPWLAESWEVSADGLTYVFRLRQGVRFHDGTPFDAAALKANFDRIADPDNILYSRTDIGEYTGSRVVDPYSLEVTLATPFAPLLRNLTMTKLAIVSPAGVAKHGKLFAQNPVGSGPFRFVSLIPGTEIRLERNPDYDWAPAGADGGAARRGPAWLDRIIFRNVPEETTRVAVVQSGQAHGCDLVPPQNIAGFRDDPAFHLQQKELLETNYSLVLNSSKAPWNDEAIRRAVRQTIDVDAIVRVVYLGTLARAWSSLSPSMFASGEADLRGSWKHDPEGAARILDAKGWRRGPDGVRVKDGKRLTISFLDSQGNREKRLDVVELVRRQLAQNGILLGVDSIPAASLLGKVKANQFDMTGGASFHSDPDMLRHAYDPTARTVAASNKVEDQQLIDWVRAAAREGDPVKRADYYHRIQRRIVDQAYAIPIYILLYNLVTAQTVHGVTLDAHGFPDFYNTWVEA